MYFSRVLQNLHKIKYTNNNVYKKHNYLYYKLIQNKHKNSMNTKIQSITIPYSFPKPILNYKHVKDKNKECNLIDSENNKNKNNTNTILYSITIGTTTILLSYGLSVYIITQYIDLLFCL
jgi:hypothetical protein